MKNGAEKVYVAVWAVLAAALSIHLFPAFGWKSLLAVGAGYLLADFVGGFVHWWADTWDSRVHRALATFIDPFREHHILPDKITTHNFWVTNGHSCLISAPLLVLGLFIPAGVIGTFLFALALGVLLTNQAHKWAHQKRVGGIVLWLQRFRLLLSPEGHVSHHSGANNTAYCVTNGMMNAPLDDLGFFRKAEALVTRLTGLVPRNNAP
jgi:ubiquitin-conjugating enzyme E2 variant